MDNHRDKITINKDGTIDDYAHNVLCNFEPVSGFDIHFKVISSSKSFSTEKDAQSSVNFTCEIPWHPNRSYYVFGKTKEIKRFNVDIYESTNNKKSVFIDFVDDFVGGPEFREELYEASLNFSIDLPKDVWQIFFTQNISDDYDYYINLIGLLDGKCGFYWDIPAVKFFDYKTQIENKSHKIAKDTLNKLKQVHKADGHSNCDIEFSVRQKEKPNTAERKKGFWR